MTTLILIGGLLAVFLGIFLALTAIGVFTNEARGVSKSLAVIEAFTAAPSELRQELAPSSSPVSVSGRITDPQGRGIKSANLSVRDINTGAIYYATTTSFGYYTFEGLLTTHFFELTASSKRYVFMPDSRTFTLSDNLAGVDFVGNTGR